MNAIGVADFPAYFECLWNYPPFDWQRRLLELVRSAGWPSTLDLPTGSGKTSTLDIALFALAMDAFEPPERRRQPRRIALVVDRRVVVDQAYDRAVRLAEALRDARDGILARVAEALRQLQSDPEALPVLPAILRGGMPQEAEWARTPHQPVLLVSTVDQVGSRLLFRGYGVSDSMRPVHAGLLGRDTLYLLDEVHLSRPFENTLATITGRYAAFGRKGDRLPRAISFVRMSATVADRSGDVFGLTETDHGNPALARRLTARKHAVLREVKTPRDAAGARERLAAACLDEVHRLGTGGANVIAVIVNRVETARRVASLATAKFAGEWDVYLVTGRMRPLDRRDLEGQLLERIKAGRQRTADRVLLVSTQAIEAGADFDFDAIVTECASLDALRQRFGRLDRLGQLGTTSAAVLAASADIETSSLPDPIYGDALRTTWQWLSAQASREGGGPPVVDFGIQGMDSRLAALESWQTRALLAPRPVAPILMPSHLDRWAQTRPAPSADPDVSPFLHGAESGSPDVQIVWRADIEEFVRAGDANTLQELLAAVPPSALEALPVPLWAAQRWLEAIAARMRGTADGTDIPALGDVEGQHGTDPEDHGDAAPVVVWRGDDSAITTDPEALRPGDTIVVPSSYGGLDAEFRCWDPSALTSVIDRGDEAHLLHRGRAVVRWQSRVLDGWGLPPALAAGPQLTADVLEERGAAAEREAFDEWRDTVVADASPPAWAKLALSRVSRILRIGAGVAAWRASWDPRRLPAAELRRLAGRPGLIEVSEAPEPSTEDDAGSFTSVEVPLERHLGGVRDFARRFAAALALPPDIVDDIALAGWLHDLGKADPRFQLMLHGGDAVAHAVAAELLAKSRTPARDRAAAERSRRRSGYPRGARHELMSVALVQDNDTFRSRATDWDLVLHLVASHHGYCRPFAPPSLDPQPVTVSARFENLTLSASSDHGLVRIDSGVSERFWRLVRRYGWWGLAWLEAILRLADHRESEVEQEGSHE